MFLKLLYGHYLLMILFCDARTELDLFITLIPADDNWPAARAELF